MDSWILLSLSAATISMYYYFFKDFNFFKKHGILYVPPWPVLGNMGPVFTRQKTLADMIQTIYNLNKDAKYVGFFDGMDPVVLLRDPELIKSVTVRNFDIFSDHRSFIDEDNDPLIAKNLFSLRGEKWQEVRSLLSPAFTSSKMRGMFKLMTDCAVNFTDFLYKVPPNKSIMEMKNCFTRYTNDVIAICAFGINVDSMKNPENDFYINGIKFTTVDIASTIKFFFIRHMPRFSKLLGINFTNNRVAWFFKDVIRETIETRDKQNIIRPDMLQLMMDTRGKRGPGRELTIEDMTSQAFIFFFGGFDTVSTLMCFAAHEIAANAEVQAKLRNEIDSVLKMTNGDVTYEMLNEMQYLDAVVNETLRMWPVAVFLDRMCAQDFELPPALPGNKPFVVKKGMVVRFSTYALHRDSKYFDNPNLFYPDRFLDKNKKDINPNVFLPFGIGPRMCIGNRFALLETKIMLFHLLARCELKPCEKTSYPLQLSKKDFTMMAEGGFWLKIQPRNDKTHLSLNSVKNTMSTDM